MLLKNADPRLCVIALLGWSFLVALVQELDAALAGLAASLMLLGLSGPALKTVLKRLLAVNGFMLLLWLALPFSIYPGEVLATFGPLEATRQGLDLALLLTVKGNAVALGAIAFFGAASVYELSAAARRLGAPEKMIAIFVLMSRYVELISQEYARLRLAMQVRAFRPAMTMHSYRGYANLIGMLLIRSLDRADRIHAAMRCRGYSGRFWFCGDFCFKKNDWMLSCLLIVLSGGVLSFVFF